jgi:hypothetical protein
MSSLEPPEQDVRVELDWNDYDTGLLTQKLYRHVKKGETSFQHEAEPGSLLASYGVAVASGVTVTVIGGLGGYLWKRIQRAEQDGRRMNKTRVIVYIENEEFEVKVESEEDAEEVRRLARLKQEKEGDQ